MYQVRGNRDACKSVGPHPPCNLSVVSQVNRPLIRSIIEATSKTVARTRKTRDYISGLIKNRFHSFESLVRIRTRKNR